MYFWPLCHGDAVTASLNYKLHEKICSLCSFEFAITLCHWMCPWSSVGAKRERKLLIFVLCTLIALRSSRLQASIKKDFQKYTVIYVKILKCKGEKFGESSSGLDCESLPHSPSQINNPTDIRTNRATTSHSWEGREIWKAPTRRRWIKFHFKFHRDSSRSSVVLGFYLKLKDMCSLLFWTKLSKTCLPEK